MSSECAMAYCTEPTKEGSRWCEKHWEVPEPRKYEGEPGEVVYRKDGKTPILDSVTGKPILVPPHYRPLIGREGQPGRMHLGLFVQKDSRIRIYVSVRLFGRWFRWSM